MKLLVLLLAVLLLAEAQLDVPSPFPAPIKSQASSVSTPIIGSTPSVSSTPDASSTETLAAKNKIFRAGLASPYDQANNAWSALTALGGGCCSACNKLCGIAFKKMGTNEYLTNVNGVYLRFVAATIPSISQIFVIGQLADCTWLISNGGSYLSTVNSNGGNWVSFKNIVESTERWYLERHDDHVHIQSAFFSGKFWQADALNILRYDYSPAKLTMEFFPCDKTFGWN
jgi:hypothetical protein